MLRKHSTAG